MLALFSKRRQVSSTEYKQHCAKVLFDDCTVKETELRHKIRKVLVKILVILRITKEEVLLPAVGAQEGGIITTTPADAFTPQKTYTWTLPTLGTEKPIAFDELDEQKSLQELIEVSGRWVSETAH